jgi:DNA/RNA-binding domain of Phe-tRNA-synthetase-like protein
MTMTIAMEPHPLLDPALFITTFPSALAQLPSAEWLTSLLRLDADVPLSRTEETRSAVRDLLRHGGYKPTGRGKPASEYLVRAAGEGTLGSINAAVDVCNVVSLHSGLPISLVDLDRAVPPLHIAIAPEGSSYVFNLSGQEIDLGGLLCLFDEEGPCANAVKDSQRTKTSAGTTRTLTVIWGTNQAGDLTSRAEAWYHDLLQRFGAEVERVGRE